VIPFIGARRNLGGGTWFYGEKTRIRSSTAKPIVHSAVQRHRLWGLPFSTQLPMQGLTFAHGTWDDRGHLLVPSSSLPQSIQSMPVARHHRATQESGSKHRCPGGIITLSQTNENEIDLASPLGPSGKQNMLPQTTLTAAMDLAETLSQVCARIVARNPRLTYRRDHTILGTGGIRGD